MRVLSRSGSPGPSRQRGPLRAGAPRPAPPPARRAPPPPPPPPRRARAPRIGPELAPAREPEHDQARQDADDELGDDGGDPECRPMPPLPLEAHAVPDVAEEAGGE